MRFSLLLCALLLGATPALAQQDGDDPSLPDIAPREVEIRGQLDITLPALQRPALTELLPRAQLAPLPPLPAPEVQTVEPPASTPQALADGNTTPSGFADLPPPKTGLLEAGGGRYFSRFARARLNLALAPQWAFRSRLDYDGTDGFQPFDDADVETPADELRGRATLRTERSGLSASLTTGGFLGRHQLYGADPIARSSLRTAPGRERYGGRAALQLHTGSERVPVDVRARYDGARVQTAVSEDDAGANIDRGEQRFQGMLNAGAPVAGARIEADVRGSTARLSSNRESARFDGATSFLDAGAGAWLLQSDALRLFAGARAMTFSSPGGAGGTYVAPEVRAEWQAASRLTLYARTDPTAEANLLADRYRENPSLLYDAPPQPTVRTVDAEGGLRFLPLRALELHAFAGYQHAPSFLFYESPESPSDAPASTEPLYERGVTAAQYGDARILRAGGSVSFRRTERVHASLSVTYRDGQLTDSDADIPYFAPVTAQALFAYGFAGGKGRVQLTGSLESARPTRRTGDEDIETFADLDVEGTYALTSAVGLVVRLQNIPAGTLERYNRYPRPPLIFESGLRMQL
ncbi:MAG: hypothetical protein BRD52_02075 [Bacteroidetes bacterium SW_4_67_19]|nr:MAG: hypothetical protein BRD52_02075 [Bacteroidetes bacterium SW_4_67_19]